MPFRDDHETMSRRCIRIDYTNHRGERSVRTVFPHGVQYGATEWHPEPQWMLNAYDVEKRADRSFALADIHGFPPPA